MIPFVSTYVVGLAVLVSATPGIAAERGAPVCTGETVVVHDDLSADFSLTQNPSGRWSYEQAGVPITAQLSGGIPELRGWGFFSSFDSSITQFVTNPNPGWHDAQLNDVVIHVASAGFQTPMSVSWRVPRAGTVNISGRAWEGAFNADRNAGWTLSINGTTLAERNTIIGTFRTDPAAAFENNLVAGPGLTGVPVSAGDVIRFSTHRLTFFGHFMGVEMSVDLTTTRCAGDIDADFTVGLGDIAAIINCWSMPASCNECADLDHDDTIGLGDIAQAIQNWASTCP